MAHLGTLLTPSSRTRFVSVLVLACLAALVWASSASAAVTQKQAASRAVDALGSEKGSAAVIVFGLPTPVKAGTKITQAGTTKPSTSRSQISRLRADAPRTGPGP